MDALEARRIMINNDQDDRLNKLEIRVGLIEERLKEAIVTLPEGWTLNHCGKLIKMDLDIPVS